MKNTKRKSKKIQKGGFFTIGGRETKSQRDLIVKCDLTDVNSINDPFLMKQKINTCCPTSTFSFFAKNKSIKCDEMKKKYEELLKKNGQQTLNINNVHDPRELEKMYLSSCPKDRFGFKNGSRLCRELDARHRDLVLQDNKEIRQFKNQYGRPTTSRRLSNFGKNMINMFNNNQKPKVEPPKVEPPKVEPLKVEPPKVEPPKVEQLQNNTNNNEDYNSDFKSVPSKESNPIQVSQEPPRQQQEEQKTQAPPETPSTEIKTGGKRIKRKSKKNNKRRKNSKTKRR